jgi:mediator of RNA polymerase II transcription subunit 12, fungi type
MDNRAPLSATTATRPPPPQRSVSGSALHFAKPSTRPSLSSRLSSVRSVSNPVNVVDLTSETPVPPEERNRAAFLGNADRVVSSPSVIDLSGEDDEPPAKRAKTTTTGFRTEDEEHGGRDERAYRAVAGSQLPTLPKHKAPQTKTAVCRRRHIDPALRKPHGNEPPAIATRLPPPKNVADFSPWTGHHPEDVLNEAVVKSGYSDKGPTPTQSECNSARPSVWQNLSSKNNMGLQILSTLFTQVMEKRQALGKCTVPSTFKPPPRVTVTDTKREAWLRDLANSEIPLRKQSRTIPHGIRGKVLMDKCLAMDIPLQRAVWLAKCVGANELRAFRRKGVNTAAAASGESKWMRDWTLQVEQFLEGVIATCGQQDWQLRMNYAVKLATSFFAEKLVETDHYLDWIISSFTEATLEKLPIWIIMVQIYWKELGRVIPRGRRLAEGILSRIHGLTGVAGQVSVALTARLNRLIGILVTTNRACLVIPGTWNRYRSLFTPAAIPGLDPVPVAPMFERRNDRLAGPLEKTPENNRCALLDLYDELDSVKPTLDLDLLMTRCLALVPDWPRLVSSLLDWASSPFREGITRVYLTASLIMNLQHKGADTDSVILDYLGQLEGRSQGELDNVYRVVAELARRECFAVGRYLKWLISSGAMYGEDSASLSVGLLGALQTDHLTHDTASLHRTLLTRSGPSSSTAHAKEVIQRLEEALAGTPAPFVIIDAGESISTKVAVAQHIRLRLPTYAQDPGLTLATFAMLRDTIEITEDIPTLASLINTAVNETDTPVLALLADAVSYHALTLAASGYLTSVLDIIEERYRTVRTHLPLDRSLITALLRLCGQVNDRAVLANILMSDLVVCEQQITNAVCSPASDSLVNMQATSLESDEEIDAVFASGNIMDDQLLQRVFTRVLQRAGGTGARASSAMSKICGWLNQLRTVGGSNFEQLATDYIRLTMSVTGLESNSAEAISALVASECVHLTFVLKAATEADMPQAATLAIRVLVENDPATTLSIPEAYRLRLLRKLCFDGDPDAVAKLLCTACADPTLDPNHHIIMDLYLDLAIRHPDTLQRAFQHLPVEGEQHDKAHAMYCTLVMTKFQITSMMGLLDPRPIVKAADPLSVKCCVGVLDCFTKKQATPDAEMDYAMQELLVDAISNGNEVWPQLVDVVSPSVKRHLHEFAQNQLWIAASGLERNEDALQVTPRYMEVMAVTNGARRVDTEVPVLATLTEKLREIEKQLSAVDMTALDVSNHLHTICARLKILLYMCTLHTQPMAAENDAVKHARANLLAVLCGLGCHLAIQTLHEPVEYTFDVASVLADSIPAELLARLAKASKATDPRVHAIVGRPPASTEAWLAIASQVQPPGGSQQQRALAKHASQQQGQASMRPNATGGNPSSGQQQQLPQRTFGANRVPVEMKTAPFPLRRWEIIPDAAPNMGENDASISLGLFGARKA